MLLPILAFFFFFILLARDTLGSISGRESYYHHLLEGSHSGFPYKLMGQECPIAPHTTYVS